MSDLTDAHDTPEPAETPDGPTDTWRRRGREQTGDALAEALSICENAPGKDAYVMGKQRAVWGRWVDADALLPLLRQALTASGAPAVPSGLSFAQLRKANVQRCETAFHALDHWQPMEWGAACAGEVGEGINAAKKLRRVQDSEQYKKTLPTTDVTVQDVADEIADTVIYADLWAASMGIDLGAVVADKFNRTSDKVQSDVKLPAPSRGGEHE